MNKKGQNFIEFVFVFPLLILFLFGTIELAFFWKNHTAVQHLASQVASYSVNYIDESNGVFRANIINFLQNSRAYNSLVGGVQNFARVPSADGSDRFDSSNGRIRVFVQRVTDNPTNFGFDYIRTRVVFDHETLLIRASYSLPNGDRVEVIPDDFTITSSEVKQYSKY